MQKLIAILMLSGCCGGGPPYSVRINSDVGPRGRDGAIKAALEINRVGGCELVKIVQHFPDYSLRQYTDGKCHGLWTMMDCELWIGDEYSCDAWNCYQVSVHEMLHMLGAPHDSDEEFPLSIMNTHIYYDHVMQPHHVEHLRRLCSVL